MQLQRGRLASGSLSKSPTLPRPPLLCSSRFPSPGEHELGEGRKAQGIIKQLYCRRRAAVNESRLEWSESALTSRVSADGCMLAFPPQTDVRLEITGWPPTIARDALRPWTRV